MQKNRATTHLGHRLVITLALAAGASTQARASCELPSSDGSGLASVEVSVDTTTGIGELVGAGLYGLATGSDATGELVFAVEYNLATVGVTTYTSNAARSIAPADPALLSIDMAGVSGDDVLMSGQVVADNAPVMIILCNIATSSDILQTGFALMDGVVFETENAPQDTDNDGVPDALDNCSDVANPQQRDTDGDNIGNRCDADLDNNCIVTFPDLSIFRVLFFTADPDADFNGDGFVNHADLAIMRASFLLPPGPSGQPNACDP